MPVRIPVSASGQPRNSWNGPGIIVAALSGLAVMFVAATVHVLPAPLVLPLLSVALLFVAGLVAVLAWLSAGKQSGERVSYWDVVGALALISICAALLSDPEHVLPLLEARRPE